MGFGSSIYWLTLVFTKKEKKKKTTRKLVFYSYSSCEHWQIVDSWSNIALVPKPVKYVTRCSTWLTDMHSPIYNDTYLRAPNSSRRCVSSSLLHSRFQSFLPSNVLILIIFRQCMWTLDIPQWLSTLCPLVHAIVSHSRSTRGIRFPIDQSSRMGTWCIGHLHSYLLSWLTHLFSLCYLWFLASSS